MRQEEVASLASGPYPLPESSTFPTCSIYSVIVCYYPEPFILAALCENLIQSGCRVILVDNSHQDQVPQSIKDAGCQVISLGRNTGLAYAQNVGIRRALACGADVVVYFDQDSRIEGGFIPNLLSPLVIGKAGVAAPVYCDNVTGREFPAHSLNRFGFLRPVYTNGRLCPYQADVIIASGTAATAQAYERAGLFDEAFYIDFIDMEWSLRCRNQAIPIYIVPSAKMKHSIGGATLDLGLITLFVHTPERCYYQIRNCFLLLRRKHVPRPVAFAEMVRVLVHRAFLLFFVGEKLKYVRNYVLALADGARGIFGEKSSSASR